MIRLDCSAIWFGSQLDEKHLFEWAMEITGVLRWEQDTLVVRSRISKASLYDLLALFSRYGIPMRQLAQFENAANSTWFRDPVKYWHEQVFGAQRSNRSFDADTHRQGSLTRDGEPTPRGALPVRAGQLRR